MVSTAAKKKIGRVKCDQPEGFLARDWCWSGDRHQSFSPPLPAGGLGVIIVGLANLHLGAFIQSIRPAGDHRVGRRQPFGDLHVIAVLNPELDRFFVSRAVRADDHHGFRAVLRSENRRHGHLQSVLDRVAGDGNLDRSSDFKRGVFIVDLQPDFERGAAGIKRRADQRNLGIHRILDAGNHKCRRIANLHLLRKALRDVRLGQQ